LHWLAFTERHWLPSFGSSFVLVRTDVVLIGCLLLSLLRPCLLLGNGHHAEGLHLLGRGPRPWECHVFLVVKLLVQFEIFVIQYDRDDALEGVLSLVQKLFEGIGDFLEHERGWIE